MSRRKPKKIFRLLAYITGLLLISAFEANAAVLNVPGDYPTIQAGIDAAQDGDTVLVAPGTYVENLDFLGKGIAVISSAGPKVTIIDGNNAGTIVTIHYAEQKQCSLQGFTLRNGSGTFATAIDILRSSPAIIGNIIDGNTEWTYGAVSADVSSPVIEKNIFRNFSCVDNYLSGVIYFANDSSPKVMDNLFLNNPCRAIDFVSPSGTSPQVANNTIVGNRVGIGTYNPSFSALHLYRNNIIVGNNIGFEVQYGTLPSDSIWQNNLVYGNAVNYSGLSDQTGIGGNISADPLFLDPADNDYHLCPGSPAIGTGDITGLDLPATDFDGNPRVADGSIDMGAYQFDPAAPPEVSFTADKVSGAAPLQVQFAGLTDKYVTGYQWDFGDGSPGSTEASPVHTFSAGVYTVSLTVTGPTGTGAVTRKDLIESYITHTITASAGDGGTITPSGATTVDEGGSLTYTVSPNPCYQLAGVFVDGVNVAGPSLIPLNYTVSDITADHTVTAVFAHYFDYFGMQAENHAESLVTYANGRKQTLTDDISLDTTSFPQPSYIDSQNQGGIASQTWYQTSSDGLFMERIQSSGYTFTLSPPLTMIRNPIEPGSSWTQTSSVSAAGLLGSAKISAAVSRQVLVKVPAGRFLAWRIAYTLTISGPGGTSRTNMTYWFAPYFGTIKGKESNATIKLTNFAIGGGTITSLPPIVTGTFPKSGTIGSTIAVNGYQFGAPGDMSEVMIGGIPCAVLSWSDTQIQCIVPDGAASGPVSVVTDTWTSNDTVGFKVLPQIAGVTPSSGKRGASVQITGTAFGTVLGKVKFGSFRAAVTQWDDTAITCTVPATATLGRHSVTVKNSQGRSVLRGAFTVVK